MIQLCMEKVINYIDIKSSYMRMNILQILQNITVID